MNGELSRVTILPFSILKPCGFETEYSTWTLSQPCVQEMQLLLSMGRTVIDFSTETTTAFFVMSVIPQFELFYTGFVSGFVTEFFVSVSQVVKGIIVVRI